MILCKECSADLRRTFVQQGSRDLSMLRITTVFESTAASAERSAGDTVHSIRTSSWPVEPKWS